MKAKIRKTYETIRKSHAGVHRVGKAARDVAKKMVSLRREAPRPPKRKCNLCGHAFRALTPFARFCKTCRAQDETFHFAEWMGARC